MKVWMKSENVPEKDCLQEKFQHYPRRKLQGLSFTLYSSHFLIYEGGKVAREKEEYIVTFYFHLLSIGF